MFNKAGVIEVSKALLRAKLKWKNPIYLVHATTARCNARCPFCAWNFYEHDYELSTEEIKQLYADARKAGFFALSFWGGERLGATHTPQSGCHDNLAPQVGK